MPTTRTIVLDPHHPDSGAIASAAAVIARGGMVAFATETVYGLGGDATSDAAVARIFEAKGRPGHNPLIVHADGPEMARGCVSAWPEPAERLARRWWPGPLTLVLPRSAIIPDRVTGGLDTVGVRVPRTAVARALIAQARRPLAAPSANRSMGISPTRAWHVAKDLEGRIDLILDSGPTEIGLESTVLDLSMDHPRLLRPGAITKEQIEEVLGQVLGEPEALPAGAVPASPGQLPVHYAPRTPTFWLEPDELDQLHRWPSPAVLVVGHPEPLPVDPTGLWIDLPRPDEAMSQLYEALHRLDAAGREAILVIPPPDRPEWRAIRDRLTRAARRLPETD